MQENPRIVILDCDGTLWKGELWPLIQPFSRRCIDTISDVRGKELRLNPHTRYTLEELHRRGVALCVVSWHIRRQVEEVLSLLGLRVLLQSVLVSIWPSKVRMVSKILRELQEKGIPIELTEVHYVDNDRSAVVKMRKSFPELRCLRFGDEIRDIEELLAILEVHGQE